MVLVELNCFRAELLGFKCYSPLQDNLYGSVRTWTDSLRSAAPRRKGRSVALSGTRERLLLGQAQAMFGLKCEKHLLLRGKQLVVVGLYAHFVASDPHPALQVGAEIGRVDDFPV